jgi:hypothetical protein
VSGKEQYNMDVINEIIGYRRIFSNYCDDFNLPTLTGRGYKRPYTDVRGSHDFDDPSAGRCKGPEEQVENHGYVVVPDYIGD